MSSKKEVLDSQMINYFKMYKEGDENARNIIVQNNLGLVNCVLKRLGLNNEDVLYSYDDLFQIGCIGLIKAVNTFDIDKKNCFSTYAFKCIKYQILCTMRKKRIKVSCGINDTVLEDSNEQLIDITGEYEDGYKILEDDDELSYLLSKLNEREKMIVKSYYGIGTESKTTVQLSKILKVSQERVTKIKNDACAKTKKLYLKIQK